jgi:hypothetical protein
MFMSSWFTEALALRRVSHGAPKADGGSSLAGGHQLSPTSQYGAATKHGVRPGDDERMEVSFAKLPRGFWSAVQLVWSFTLVHYIFHGIIVAAVVYVLRDVWAVRVAGVLAVLAYQPSFWDGSERRLGRQWEGLRRHPIWTLTQARRGASSCVVCHSPVIPTTHASRRVFPHRRRSGPSRPERDYVGAAAPIRKKFRKKYFVNEHQNPLSIARCSRAQGETLCTTIHASSILCVLSVSTLVHRAARAHPKPQTPNPKP